MKLRVSAVLLSIVLFIVILLNVFTHAPNKVAWAAAPYDDEFNTASLNTRWSWLNEDPSRWSLSASPGNLRITATGGDMFSAVCGNSQAKNVLLQQAPIGNFAIEVKLSILPTANYQQAGLLVFKDTNTYFKIGPAYEQQQWGGQGLQAVLVTNGGIAARFGFHVDLISPMYLRLTKLNDRYLGHYSLDGQTWMLIGQVQTNAITDPKIGVFALTSCIGNAPDIAADFDYFHTFGAFYSIFLPLTVSSNVQAPTPYKSQWDENAGLGWNNCGPASVAMAMAHYKKNISVDDAAIWIRGVPDPHANTTTDFKKGSLTGNNTNSLLDENGLLLVDVNNFDSMTAQLDLKRPVLMLVKNNYYVRYDDEQQRLVPYTKREGYSQHKDGTLIDHIVVVTGYDHVNVYINDPLAVMVDSKGKVVSDSQNGTNFAVPVETFKTAAGAEGWYGGAVASK